MDETTVNWRRYPEGIPASQLAKYGRSAAARGDIVEAGNWFIHAKRLGYEKAGDLLEDLLPHLEDLISERNDEANALLAGIFLDQRKDLPRALALFEAAAAAGVAEAKRGLGFMLTNGIGRVKDSETANRLFLEAAGTGDGYAAYNLAINYYKGEGVTRDARKFTHWLRIAAESGIPEACALLGDTLSSQNKEAEALTWYLRAAGSGHAPAMLTAARRYQEGIGTGVDPVQAVRWYLSMLDRGNGDGIHEALTLAASMTPEQIRLAGQLSAHESDAELLIRG